MNKKGFTLIELLAIIVILAIILAISIPASVTNIGPGTIFSDALTNITIKGDCNRFNSIWDDIFEKPISIKTCG